MLPLDFPEFDRESLPGAIDSLSFEEAETLALGASSLEHNGADFYGVSYHRNSSIECGTLEYYRANSAVSGRARRSL